MASPADPHSVLYKGVPAPFRPKRANQVKVQRYFAGVTPNFKPDNEVTDVEENPPVVQGKEEVYPDETLDLDTLDAGAPKEEVAAAAGRSHKRSVNVEPLQDQRQRRRLAALQAQQQARDSDQSLPDLDLQLADGDPLTFDEEQQLLDREPQLPHLLDEESHRSGNFTDGQKNHLLKPGDESAARDADRSLEARIEQSSSSEGEDEEDDEEDEANLLAARPVFIPAKQRRQLSMAEAAAAAERRAQIAAERKEASRAMLIESVERSENAEKERIARLNELNSTEPKNMPSDDDNDDEAEYNAWRLRELERLRRSAIERQMRLEFEETLRQRRLMTEKEKQEDDQRLDSLKPKEAPKSKYRFLQKYYHKGAFFQDLASEGKEQLYLRDFNAPVAEEKIDRSALPKPMQLRRGQWGQKGQVKHTHLADVDTTDKNSAWAKIFKKNDKRDKVI